MAEKQFDKAVKDAFFKHLNQGKGLTSADEIYKTLVSLTEDERWQYIALLISSQGQGSRVFESIKEVEVAKDNK